MLDPSCQMYKWRLTRSTTTDYSRYFEKWKISVVWYLEITDLPAVEFGIVFICWSCFKQGMFPIIRISFYAINYFHTLGYQNPCTNSLSSNVLEGINRFTGYSVTKILPVTAVPLYKL